MSSLETYQFGYAVNRIDGKICHMTNYDKRGERFSQLVGLELRGAISAHGYEAQAVAGIIGIHSVTLSRYLNGHRIIPSSVVSNVAEAVGAHPEEIVARAYTRLIAEMGAVSDLGYTLAASDHDYDEEMEAMEREP